jgi:C-terminal processing protease CtpA/Prc
MKSKTLSGIAAAIILATPMQAVSQDAPASRGWIGISFRLVATGTATRVDTLVLIDEVNAGSPAQSAGLRAGDFLVAINEIAGPDSLMSLNEHLHLDPGDPVRLLFVRNGQQRRLTLHAADRGDRPAPSRTITVTFQPDSMVETMVQAMESLRVRLVEANGDISLVAAPGGRGTVSVVGPPTQVRVADAVEDSRERMREWEFATGWTTTREVQAPFAFGLFRGERYDSLHAEMESMNRMILALRASEIERERDLRSAGGGTLRAVDQNDQVLQDVRSNLVDLFTESRRLRKAMDNSARENAGSSYVLRSAPRTIVAGVTEPSSSFRPLAPYLLGENRAAGAEVRDLDPEFADALGVEGSGVLVLDVPAGTPAAIAGIRVGDVITHIDQVLIRSVDDLRLGLSRAGAETPVTLVRQRTTRQVLLRR